MFPRWLSWLVLGLFAYLLVSGNRSQREALPTATPPATVVATPVPSNAPQTTSEHPALNAAIDLERWKKAVNPDYAARAQCEFVAAPSDTPTLLWKVTQDRVGDGAAARCSETITLKLTVWDARGKVAYTSELPFVMGAREVAAGLDAALLGIRNGGVRTVVLSPAALTRNSKVSAPKALLAALGNGHVVIVTAERIK